MVSTIASLTASIAMAATMATTTFEPDPEWVNVGEYRITTYCPVCNDGAGHESSSGIPLEYGCAASKDFPIGTTISIEGEQFVITDVCGMDNTIDIFIDDDSGVCHCNRLDYRNVSIKY